MHVFSNVISFSEKYGIHVLFGFVLSSEQSEVKNNSLNFAHAIFLAFVAVLENRVAGNFMQVRKEIHEELKGAEESYWAVFPVKLTEQF